MKFYVIPPVSAMDLALMGDRIYVLAHLWVKYPNYREFIMERKKGGWFITLDNSAAERALVTEEILINITKELLPDEVIAPDILLNGHATRKATESFITNVTEALGLDWIHVDIFGCPQGYTKDEWLESYKWMHNNPAIEVIGLSKIAVPNAFVSRNNDQKIKEARRMAVAELDHLNLLKKPLHCLGMGDPREYKMYKGLPELRSTDSCYSILAAQNGVDFTRGNFDRIPTPHDYFESTLTSAQRSLAEKNILWMRKELH